MTQRSDSADVWRRPDVAHGFLDERNQIDFHEKLSGFFERHLAAPSGSGRVGPDGPAAP